MDLPESFVNLSIRNCSKHDCIIASHGTVTHEQNNRTHNRVE